MIGTFQITPGAKMAAILQNICCWGGAGILSSIRVQGRGADDNTTAMAQNLHRYITVAGCDLSREVF